MCFERLLAEHAALTAALAKISAIRDSIVGLQQINWSAHVYPLVAALGEAGFEGIGYEKARKEAHTLLDQRDAAVAESERLTAALATRDAELAQAHSAILKLADDPSTPGAARVMGCVIDMQREGFEKTAAERDAALRDLAEARAQLAACRRERDEAVTELAAKQHAYDITADAVTFWARKARTLAQRVSLAESGGGLRRNGPTIRLLAARDETAALLSPLAALGDVQPPSAGDAERIHREALIETTTSPPPSQPRPRAGSCRSAHASGRTRATTPRSRTSRSVRWPRPPSPRARPRAPRHGWMRA